MAAATGGYFGISGSLAYVMRSEDPAWAHALAPDDGRITAQRAQAIANDPDATPGARSRADALAMLALRQDPTAVAAVGALAIDSQIRGNLLGARRLFGYAERLSRRDLQVQLWAIEDAVTRGDVSSVLRHYDVALRTSSNAPDMLFPILSTAIADPAVRRQVVRTLAASPAWGEAFLNFVAARGTNPRATVQLFSALHRRSIAMPAEASAALIDALIVAGFGDDAWDYYALIRPGGDRRRSRDPRFTAMPDTPFALDWSPVNDGSADSSIQRNGTGGFFEFTVPPSVGGPLLHQTQLLPPGDYKLAGRSSEIDQPLSSLPYWILTCRNDGRELGRAEMPSSTQAGGVFRGSFRVPADCLVQTLTLVARPSATLVGLSGRIEQVQLAPAR